MYLVDHYVLPASQPESPSPSPRATGNHEPRFVSPISPITAQVMILNLKSMQEKSVTTSSHFRPLESEGGWARSLSTKTGPVSGESEGGHWHRQKIVQSRLACLARFVNLKGQRGPLQEKISSAPASRDHSARLPSANPKLDCPSRHFKLIIRMFSAMPCGDSESE